MCPECDRILKEIYILVARAMLFMRWKKTFRNRCAGIGCKTPIGAVIKSHGIERMWKRQLKKKLSVVYREAERK